LCVLGIFEEEIFRFSMLDFFVRHSCLSLNSSFVFSSNLHRILFSKHFRTKPRIQTFVYALLGSSHVGHNINSNDLCQRRQYQKHQKIEIDMDIKLPEKYKYNFSKKYHSFTCIFQPITLGVSPQHDRRSLKPVFQ
jgi:hypothetical protein